MTACVKDFNLKNVETLIFDFKDFISYREHVRN